MATIQVKSDRKQISLILNLMKIDCADLYGKFHQVKTQLKAAIERYEEFMTTEINDSLFQCNNNFSEIVLNHRAKFTKFIEEISDSIQQQTATTLNGTAQDSGIYVLFITLQHWLVQGPKGQHFCFMIDIDSFSYTNLSKLQNFSNSKKVCPQTPCMKRFILLVNELLDMLTEYEWLYVHFIGKRCDHRTGEW